MFTWMWVFEMAALLCSMSARASNRTTCEEFAHAAHFDPHEVLDSMWKIFYYWANHTEINPIMFALPVKKDVEKFKSAVMSSDENITLDWTKARLLMSARVGTNILLISKGSPVAYHTVILRKPLDPDSTLQRVNHSEIRMKSVGLYIGLMACEEGTAYAMVRMGDIPPDNELEAAAATLGFRGEGGHNYKYRPPKDEL